MTALQAALKVLQFKGKVFVKVNQRHFSARSGNSSDENVIYPEKISSKRRY